MQQITITETRANVYVVTYTDRQGHTWEATIHATQTIQAFLCAVGQFAPEMAETDRQ